MREDCNEVLTKHPAKPEDFASTKKTVSLPKQIRALSELTGVLTPTSIPNLYSVTKVPFLLFTATALR